MNHTACDWSSVCLRPRANVVCPKMASEIVLYIWWAIPVGVLCLWPPCVPHYSSVLPMGGGGGGWQMQIIWAMNAWSCYKYLWRSPIYWLCPCLAGPIIPHLGGEKVVVTIRKRARYATLKLKKKKVDILESWHFGRNPVDGGWRMQGYLNCADSTVDLPECVHCYITWRGQKQAIC